jgi:hypothetical protein
MSAPPYLAVHRIWLHSPKMWRAFNDAPQQLPGPTWAHCNLDNLNSYCRRPAPKHQCTMRGDARFALQPDESLDVPPS